MKDLDALWLSAEGTRTGRYKRIPEVKGARALVRAHAAHFARLEMCVERFLLRFGSESTGEDESSEVDTEISPPSRSPRSLRANGKYNMYTFLEAHVQRGIKRRSAQHSSQLLLHG